MSRSVFPLFSSRVFTISGLKFKSLIHFELIFVYDVRQGSNFILWHMYNPIFPTPFIDEISINLIII